MVCYVCICSVMAGIIEAYPGIKAALQDTSYHWTMFVPDDSAFEDMPTVRAQTLGDNPWMLRQVTTSLEAWFEGMLTFFLKS